MPLYIHQTTFKFNCYQLNFKVKMPKADTPDYYYNESGYMVFTETYLKKRGYCCGNGCRHCPYQYEGVKDQKLRQKLLSFRKSS